MTTSGTPDSPSTPDRSFANIPVLPPPKRSPHKSPKLQPQSPTQSPTLPLPPVQSPIPTTPKSALRFPQLEPRSRSNSNTSNRSRSPSPLRKVVFSPKEELINGGSKHNNKDHLPSLSDLKDLNQRDLKELKDQQTKDFGSFVNSSASLDTDPPRSPKGRSKSVGAVSPVDIPTLPQPNTMHTTTTTTTPTSPFPSYITPVSTAFSLGLAVGLSISAIRPTLEKAVNHGSSWLAWLFKTAILWTVIGAAAYMAFTLGKAVLVTVQQNSQQQKQQQQQQAVHQLPPTPRGDPFEGLKPNKSSSGSAVSSSSSKSATSTKSSGSAASIYEFNKYVDAQKVKRRGQKDEEHSFRPYPARPQLSSTAPGKIYGSMS